MKRYCISHRPLQFVTEGRRNQLLAAFERSGLSAAAFARQQQISYTTFCGWRQRQARSKPPVAFAEVELPAASAPAELLIELGGPARMRVSSGQLSLAAQLLQQLQGGEPC
jgi:hypothetical protein